MGFNSLAPVRCCFYPTFRGGYSFLLAVRTLTIGMTLGLKGKLVTFGLYRYSRNPQYVGAILFFSGLILLFNSFYAFVIATIGNLWFLLSPFIEEPWLREQYKTEYIEYCKQVSRFT
jgi:protein-S-isoprenylcysteine O-methyltransferase Ste14